MKITQNVGAGNPRCHCLSVKCVQITLLLIVAGSVFGDPATETGTPESTSNATTLETSKNVQIVSYEWSYVDVQGDTSLPPYYQQIDMLDVGQPLSIRQLTDAYPDCNLVVMGGIPIVQKFSSPYTSNLDAIVSVSLSNPALADVLLEINRQINCNLLFGTKNKMDVGYPIRTRVWFPKGFLDKPIAEDIRLSSVTARDALVTIFQLSDIKVRFTYWNSYLPNTYGKDAVALSFLRIDFFDGEKIISLPEHIRAGSEHVPPWVNEEDILTDDERRYWFKRFAESNKPGDNCPPPNARKKE